MACGRIRPQLTTTVEIVKLERRNSDSMTQAHNNHSQTRGPLNRFAVCVMIIGLLLGACGKRPDAEITPAAPTPRPKASTAKAPVPKPPKPITQKPQPDLAQMFSAATGELSSVKTSEEFAKIRPYNHVSLSPQSDGLKITATGGDPAVLLPPFRGEQAIAEIVIDSPADTTLQLFYRFPGQASYNQVFSIKVPTKTGKNVIYAELPGPGRISVLRLDAGEVPGEYVLRSFQAKRVLTAGAP
jgi:hypothetical protein